MIFVIHHWKFQQSSVERCICISVALMDIILPYVQCIERIWINDFNEHTNFHVIHFQMHQSCIIINSSCWKYYCILLGFYMDLFFPRYLLKTVFLCFSLYSTFVVHTRFFFVNLPILA